ncbi:MAG: DUF1697 domain-containing protein [Nocardioidaceae bacterium]|nr:DUF1697 domain-containing protein [Nocardioidaceae bacterium]
MPDRRVVLLRAVNLGARNKVPMARLRELVESAGATEVSTFIASGNLLCVPPGDAADFDRTVERLVLDDLGVTTDAISRSASELLAAREAHRLPVDDPKLSAVWFLRDDPDPAGVAALRERETPGAEWEHVGRELHLRYTGNGVHDSKLTAPLMNRLLGTPGTGRNLTTVEKLHALATS